MDDRVMERSCSKKTGFEGQDLVWVRARFPDGSLPAIISTFRYEQPDLCQTVVLTPLATVRADTMESFEVPPEVRQEVLSEASRFAAEQYEY